MKSRIHFERERKVLISSIVFCTTVVLAGSLYIYNKFNPIANIIKATPDVLIDSGDEITGEGQDVVEETEPHSTPADSDNTGESVESGAGNEAKDDNSGSGSNTGNGGSTKGSTGNTNAGNGNTGTKNNGGSTGSNGNTGKGSGGSASGGTSSGATSGGNSNSGGSASTPSTPSTPNNNSGNTTPAPQGPTQAELNDQLRQSIQNKYRVNIKYGEEVGPYQPVKQYAPVKIYDDATIRQYLLVIDSAMALYPNGFFQEMINSGMTLNIFLVKRIGGNISGLTETFESGYVTILLQTDDGSYFAETMHHELMHYFDGYMRIKRGDNSAASRMAALNPPNYNYGDSYNRTYVYTGANAANAYFISSYGKTNYLEDRATIYSDMVTRGSCPAYYTKGYPLNEKAKSIAQQIESNYATVSPNTTEFWERCVAY
ncbi:hypothetical protein IJ102_03300 [Candidatus Saccharibacteria bacterium]|nr:hypothetical protein [Candidatus Saccharibacteria bacterium]